MTIQDIVSHFNTIPSTIFSLKNFLTIILLM